MSPLERAGVPDGEAEDVQWVDHQTAFTRLNYPSDAALLSQAIAHKPLEF